MADERKKALAYLLTAEQMRLYRTNAWFSHAVDVYMKLTDACLAGLEQQAEAKDAELQRDAHAMAAAANVAVPNGIVPNIFADPEEV